MLPSIVRVAVGVIINSKSEVLISKRAANVHQASLWEFPGGKLEKNESIEDALARELQEELDIDVKSSKHLTSITFDYGDKKVNLITHLVTEFSGVASGKEGQPIKWVKISDLNNFEFPKANTSIINIIQLPDIIQITGDFSCLNDLISKCNKCFDRGITLLHFRAHQLSDVEYLVYAKELLKICKDRGVKLILNRTSHMLNKIDADGLHLSRHEMKKHSLRPCKTDKLFSVSCHNDEELEHADILDVDYCFLSPLNKAGSHDAGEPLGNELFSSLSLSRSFPIYALGGMTTDLLEEVKTLNARGIAIISEYWV